MQKKFTMENDVGIPINYTVLGKMDDYIVYTNYMPSDNELGIRLLVGKLVSEDPFEVKKVSNTEAKPIIEDFKMAIITSGKKIRRVK
ncbi:MAG: hypothetical protein II625_08375 [Bacilli bacterium]|nr:hypothetical protein [Bacilli bacterium]